MRSVAIIIGLGLILIGLVGYFLPEKSASDRTAQESNAVEPADEAKDRSPTALIPAGVGILLLGCGLIAVCKPNTTKQAMHLAAAIALLGALAAAGRGIPSLIKLFSGDPEANSRAIVFLALMGILCGLYVILSIRSFMAARQQS